MARRVIDGRVEIYPLEAEVARMPQVFPVEDVHFYEPGVRSKWWLAQGLADSLPYGSDEHRRAKSDAAVLGPLAQYLGTLIEVVPRPYE